ncbi:MAG: CDP-alcohol phosphatidyltransferase family protein [Syntrophorhabdaceae bacterium]|nr:CDP-alcohol phosphatidyltransferase family protein [Syntrophorhabdaceae bacterium]
MISEKIGHSLDPFILEIYRFFFRDKRINPNVITVLGVLLGFLSALAISLGYLKAGGIIIILSGFFDMMDGVIARTSNRVTPFGGFLDSVLDRYSDLTIMLGVFIYYMSIQHIFYGILVFIAAMGIAIIPYARARAEAASFGCKIGLLERPERLIILIAGLLFNLLGYAIIVLAVLSHVTVIQRIFFVMRTARKAEEV